MVFLTILFFLIFILLIVFSLNLMNLLKEKEYKKTVIFLKKYTTFFLVVIIFLITCLILISITQLNLNDKKFSVVIIAKALIYSIFLIFIVTNTIHLVDNLKKDIIFDKNNSYYIFDIGRSFIFISIFEGILGLFLGIIYFLSSSVQNFTLYFSFHTFLLILIGIIFFVISFIINYSIDIYEENKLTI